MAKTQIIWTILPNGTTSGNQQQVSVVVSPRLTPQDDSEHTLVSFEEFLYWTPKIDDLKNNFSAVIGDGTEIPLELTSWNLEDATALWSCLFNQDTLVNGFQYKDMSEVTLRSYSISNILGYLKEYYAKLAVSSPSELPRLLPWDKKFPDSDEAHPDLKEMLEEAWPEKKKLSDFNRFFNQNFSESTLASGIECDLYEADRFYRRSQSTEEEFKRRPDFNPEDIPAPPEEPKYDFHSIVAALADYPVLMRRLGLVLDFTLRTPIQIPLNGKLRLRINRQPHSTVTDITPWTAFRAENGRFFTSPRTDYQKQGLLNLSNSDDSYTNNNNLFDIYQVDPDGAALKTVNFVIVAQNIVRRSTSTNNSKYGEITYTTGDRQGLAALRSGGLGVSQRNRARDVKQDATKMKDINSSLESSGNGNDICFYAEDVSRGYRVDVADVTNVHEPPIWRTLCARKGKYWLVNSGDEITFNGEITFDDEGYVCGASTTSEKSDSNEHYLHESLFRWTGWSLCTPRPGKMLKANESNDGSHIQYETPSEIGIEDTVAKGSGVSATFTTPKGSLPRLRFGHLYRIRARIVDLAGNSLAVDDPANEGASKAVGYYRFEPIDPPVLVHRTRVSEGESLERMVIRSNYDVSAERYLNTTEPFKKIIEKTNDNPDAYDFHYGKENERHFVPPKSSQQQCETHGLFDGYFGTDDWEQIKKGYAIAGLESGTLYDGLDDPEKKVKIITPSALDGIATTKGKPALPSSENPVGDRMVGGQYLIYDEEQIKTPWLPDAAAGGIAIRAAKGHQLPGVKRETDITIIRPAIGGTISCKITKINGEFVILVKNGKGWPASCGFRLILAEANIAPSDYTEDFTDNGTPPVWNEDKRTLTFFVSKGWIVRLLYSSFADAQYIDSFGIPQWVLKGNIPQWVPEDAREFVKTTAKGGANWLIAPFRELTLVHATQAPVLEPKFNDLRLFRELGSHDVTLKAEIKDRSKGSGISLHGPSTGKFEVVAKWQEWVDDVNKPEPERVKFSGQLGEINLAENYPNCFNLKDAVDAQLPDINDTDAPQQRGDVHALGDTRFRLIEYQIRATTRFREYLPPSIYENQDDITQLSLVATGDEDILLPKEDDFGAPVLPPPSGVSGSNKQSIVLASAPPAEPKVLYVVPTMRWQPNKKTKDHDVTRIGNGLRVWLDRPWFSSGDGEMLGVVISNGTFDKIDEKMKLLVTQWGLDPFWDSDKPKSQIKETDFPARVKSENLSLLENTSPAVTIVGHRVHWDDDRRLWYCDIELDPLTTYMPFVRLALVRYQPHALNGAKVSKVVLTDFAQVLPRRRATVKIEGNKITAALRGPDPSFGPMKRDNLTLSPEKGRNRVELVLQTRDPKIDSDLSWRDTKILVGGSDTIGLKSIVVEQVKDTPISVKTGAGTTVQLDSKLTLSKLQQLKPNLSKEIQVQETDKLRIQPVDIILEKPFWEVTATLPEPTKQSMPKLPASKLPVPVDKDATAPRRLMIREFERFYKNAGTETREIGERLVFADIIDLLDK